MLTPRIRVVSLGGTIAMGASGQQGVSHSLDAADLVSAVPGLDAVGAVEAVALRQIPGSHLAPSDVASLAGEIDKAFADGVDGVVVTQGTDTIEETSFLLELLGAARRGVVVVTGAMRNPTLPGADGPANLLAAVTAAAAPECRGLGVLVVMNDEVHAARFVAKRHASSTSAFASGPGPLGWIAEGRLILVTRPLGALDLAGPAVRDSLAAAAPSTGSVALEVAMMRTWLGDDGRWVRAVGELGYGGLVVEGSGGGHVNAPLAPLLGELAARIPVVIASRTGAGAALRSTYAFEGGETDLGRRGLVNAGWLSGQKARLLLLVLVNGGASRDEIDAAFARFRAPEPAPR